MKRVPWERRVVTALFADIADSSALAHRLDPEEARLIVTDALAQAIRTVERYGGTVKDLAGDGMLALFGAPVAHEDDPERAVRAGLEIVESAAEHGMEVRRAWGVEGFAMRVGIDTGEVVVGMVGAGSKIEYGASGSAVNLAARMQQAAEKGTVLVTEATRSMTGSAFEWLPAEERHVRGWPAPVMASRVIGAAETVPAPELSSLVGRQSELAVAEEALANLARGRGGLLFVSGEPGIGKSRMLAELRRLAGAAGGIEWLEGRCVSYGEALTYSPYREMLRHWLSAGPRTPEMRVRIGLKRLLADRLGDEAAALYPYLASVLGLHLEPEESIRFHQISPESLKFRTFEVFGQLLTRVAEKGPVVLALDDLHWADPTSVQLTQSLLAVAENHALLIAIGHRPDRDHSSWELREAAAREYPHIFRGLELAPLTREAEASMLLAIGGTALHDEIRGRILRYAEGNPFYLEEIVRSLSEEARAGGALSGALEIPDSLEAVVMARIDRLPPSGRSVLTAASLLGRTFGRSLLESVAGDIDGKLAEALHDLLRLDMIQEERRWPEPEYRFKHTLIQDAAYRTLLAPERAALHRRAASWLEERHRDHLEEVYALLAHHYFAAGEEATAVHYLALAGDQARDGWALDEAIGHYRQLVTLLKGRGETGQAAETLFKLALSLHTAMRYREAATTWREAFTMWPRSMPPGTPPTATLRVAAPVLPSVADPQASNSWTNIQLCMQMFDRLVEAWPNRNIVPSLAESWDVSEDGLRYVFKLRAGLKWNDGSPLVAQDFVTAMIRNLDPTRPGASVSIYFVLDGAIDYHQGVDKDPGRVGIRALDERTVEFRLATPAPYFMSVVNRPDANPSRPGGALSGPFAIEEMRSERTVLVRDPGYAGSRRGNVARVEWLRLSIDQARAALKRDEVDLVLARYGLASAEALGGGTAGAATWSVYLSPDVNRPPTSNADFRRALAHSIYREAFAAASGPQVLPGTGGIVPPALQGHTPDIARPFDPDRARTLLTTAGGPTAIHLGTAAQWSALAELVAECWRDVLGLDVSVSEGTFQRKPKTDDEDPHIILENWLPGYPDPEYYLRLLLHSRSLSNRFAWSYKPFDDLVERAIAERSGPSRLALFHQADKLAIQDQCALIPVAYYRPYLIAKPWLQGYWEWGKSAASFADLVLAETAGS